MSDLNVCDAVTGAYLARATADTLEKLKNAPPVPRPAEQTEPRLSDIQSHIDSHLAAAQQEFQALQAEKNRQKVKRY